ncbi:MAG: hypothetical protein RL701_6257 [Pseudomonadota bacterium]
MSCAPSSSNASCNRVRKALCAGILLACALCVWTPQAHAWVLQIPKGGEFATFPKGRVLCGPAPQGFAVDATRHKVKPKDDTPVGQALAVVLAQSEEACKTAAVEDSTLIVTGDHPRIDPNSVTVAIDAGRLELRGDGLEGVRIGFSADDKSGDDVCLNVTRDKERDVCALNIDRSLPADPHRIELRWGAPGARASAAADVITYDKNGDALAPEQTRLAVARLLISRMIPEARMVDVARGVGKVALIHPEAVSGADCGVGRCETNAEGLMVTSVPASASKLAVKLQLSPRVFFSRGDLLDNVIGETLTVLRCPVTMVSGEPLRNVDELNVLLRLDPACSPDVNKLHFVANAEPSEIVRVETMPDGVYVLLWIGRVSSERLTVVVSREDGSVLSVVSERTAGVPAVMATLSLAGFGEIQFIPRNRAALVNVSHIAGKGELVPVSVPGAYVVTRGQDGYQVRGVYAAGGYAALRFAYRIAGVPDAFADTDFGQIVDPVQRPIREASIPAPIGASSVTDRALVELFCKDSTGKLTLIGPGSPVHIPFRERDSCRLVLHRERIPAESGEQRLDVDISVTSVSGGERSDAHLSEHFLLRHADEREVMWIRGARDQFDRINVRITHIIDESLFDNDVRRRLELPSSQWTVVTENAAFKFYATAAIPASLYRFTGRDKGSGTLALNLGLLGRLTWLDDDGHEGLLALEAGTMGMGLADSTNRLLAIVAGLGISIPLGNANQATQAAVNIHMWLSYTIGSPSNAATVDMMDTDQSVSHWAFVFGPSITVGSIGALL